MRSTSTSPLVLLLFVLTIPGGMAQTAPTDPRAIALITQSLSTMTSGKQILDISLTAKATSLAGSESVSGEAELLAKGSNESRIVVSLTSGGQTETRNNIKTLPSGQWLDSEGKSHSIAAHNCLTDSSWFFPPLLAGFSGDPSVMLKYVGIEKRDGIAVQHIQSRRLIPNVDKDTSQMIQDLSLSDLYFDATFLPVALTFQTHPDDDASTSIPVEVRFGEYQLLNGVYLPTHIQRYLQGNLTLDLSVTAVVLNSGLSDSLF